MSLNTSLEFPSDINITNQIFVQPLDKHTLTHIKDLEDNSGDFENTLNINQGGVETAIKDKTEIVAQLVTRKKNLNKDIFKMTRLIEQHKQTIKNIECDLWETCDHEWIYDDWANFDDRTKYLCKICGCYRNSYWYTRR